MNQFAININDISVIIPVKDNQNGINKLLESFFYSQEEGFYPKELIIVDNNSNQPLLVAKEYLNKGIDVFVENCLKKGPAAARNIGVDKASGSWLLFVDSDCVFTKTTLKGYLNPDKEGVAYAGKVLPYKRNTISDYYSLLNLLNPPASGVDLNQAQYVVTANCLVNKRIFLQVKGFDETFEIAGGEDVDLGFRLSKIGEIYYAKNSLVRHNYKNNLYSFYRRFYRYGEGLSMLEKKYNLIIDWKSMIPQNRGLLNIGLSKLLSYAIKKGKEVL